MADLLNRACEPLADIVDLDRYPIDDLESSAGRLLIDSCREQLAERDICQLPGFLRPDAIEVTLAVAQSLKNKTWTASQDHNVYFVPVPDSDPTDARALLQQSSQQALAYDLLPADLPLRALYENDVFLRFVAAALSKPILYRSVDPLDALDISMFDPGQELGWHFDNSDFSITLMLQPAEAGGYFDYVAHLRSADDDNHAGVSHFLRGGSNEVPVRLSPTAGMLSLFQGREALHRVTPVEGSVTRVNSVLTFGDRPDMQLSELTRQLFYGRLA